MVARILLGGLALVLLLLAVFRTPRTRHRAAWAAVAATALVFLVVALVGVSVPRAALTRAWLVLTGGLVDAGGFRLRVECLGSGNPTVVMDTGLAQPRTTWGRVPSQVALFARVCTYDRAGLGESDPGPKPRTSQVIVDELQRLLLNANVRGPYVLVGHSFGGLNVRLFASEHPTDVVGMVLVDASREDQTARMAALLAAGERDTYLRHERGDNSEQVDVEASGAQLQLASPMQVMPLIVLSARPQGPNPQTIQLEYEMQDELAKLEPNSTHLIVENSGHFIQLDQPEAVIDAIRTVVQEARGK